jgi:DNA-binding NtrC family response regulator
MPASILREIYHFWMGTRKKGSLMTGTAILVIDDERVICEGCRLVLGEQGHAVTCCTRGQDGLRQLEQKDYDVLLLDMKLPDTDGMQILGAVRQSHPQMHIIVMTGYASVQNAVEAMKQGAFDYLSKPFSDDELTLTVAKAIDNLRLIRENLALRQQLFDRFNFSNIIGEHPKILKVFDQVRRVAPTDSTILIQGDSGTGKELFAKAIHAHSQRAAKQFVAFDCSTIASTLVESELFGHVKGAFTGATQNKAGIFELAKGGTLFLDEVSNLSLEIQGKLLRAMEAQEYKPVGAAQAKTTDMRVIAATNRDLRAMVEEGGFREDLFYRLNVFPIYLPSLRERKEDIPRLAYHFLRSFCRQTGKRIEGFSNDALEMLVRYDWPGNVRQLKNVIEHLVIMADKAFLDIAFVSEQLQTRRSRAAMSIPDTMEELKALKKNLLQDSFGRAEKAFLEKALQAANGNITRAAKKVGMQRSNFSVLMKKHHLTAVRQNRFNAGRLDASRAKGG